MVLRVVGSNPIFHPALKSSLKERFGLLSLYIGHISNIAGCKSLHTPGWKEVLATGKGVVCESKSGGSHQQRRGNDAQKSDIRLHGGWQAGNGLRKSENQPYPHTVNQA